MRAVGIPRRVPGRVAASLHAPDGIVGRLERSIVPAATPHDESRPDDYRRAVILIAILAVGFFPASLAIADVPVDRWLPFLALASAAGLIIAGSFVLLPKGSRLVGPWVVINSVTVAVVGHEFHAYYHQIGLLFALIVAAHAIVHGFGAGALAVALGSILTPYVIEGHDLANPTDPVYAGIYLLGLALIPWVASRLAGRRLVQARLHLQAVEATEREAVQMLARAAEAKDDVTGDHVGRVGELAARLATTVGLDEELAEDLRFAGMLHDVGKLHVPDSILMKPGPLDPEEWEIVRRHTTWGQRILGDSPGFALARSVARSHHENWDGSGYPDGLRAEAIPIAARIVHLADVFDALRAHRPYKPAWPLERCIAEIASDRGRMFDPELVDAFLWLADEGWLTRPADARAQRNGIVATREAGGLDLAPVPALYAAARAARSLSAATGQTNGVRTR